MHEHKAATLRRSPPLENIVSVSLYIKSELFKSAAQHFLFEKQTGMAHAAYIFRHPALSVRMNPVRIEWTNGTAEVEAAATQKMIFFIPLVARSGIYRFPF